MTELALLYQLPGLVKFFVGFLLILTFYTGALSFTYWISKDE